MADTATLQLRLSEAEFAFHRLATGTAEVEIEQDGIKVKYAMASMDKLRLYIADLRDQLAAQGVVDATAQPRRRPLYAAM